MLIAVAASVTVRVAPEQAPHVLGPLDRYMQTVQSLVFFGGQLWGMDYEWHWDDKDGMIHRIEYRMIHGGKLPYKVADIIYDFGVSFDLYNIGMEEAEDHAGNLESEIDAALCCLKGPLHKAGFSDVEYSVNVDKALMRQSA